MAGCSTFERVNWFYPNDIQVDIMQVQQVYIERMYRFGSIHLFKIPSGETFKARIAQVEPDGQLKLDLLNGQIAGYYFKEIEFVI